MSAMGNFVIEVAELVHVGNVQEIERKLQPLEENQKFDVLMHAIEANFNALSLCDCSWCEKVRDGHELISCRNCKNKFSLEDGGFILDGLSFCEQCDPESGG